jgi:hypothetical protein
MTNRDLATSHFHDMHKCCHIRDQDVSGRQASQASRDRISGCETSSTTSGFKCLELERRPEAETGTIPHALNLDHVTNRFFSLCAEVMAFGISFLVPRDSA